MVTIALKVFCDQSVKLAKNFEKAKLMANQEIRI